MKIVIGLGSNQDHRLSHLRAAIRRLKEAGAGPTPWFSLKTISPLYESDALLPENAPESWNIPYLNLCVLGESSVEPREFLLKLKSIENDLGRKKRERWAPREIDLDILAMDDRVIEDGELRIPHRDVFKRPFAALPFADLLPDWVHPKTGERISEWVAHWRRSPRSEVPFRTHRSFHILPKGVGILNFTPDSFSDGGQFDSIDAALRQLSTLIEQGAEILDIGAESTRPGVTPVDPETEWARLQPLMVEIRKVIPKNIKLSIDTRHPSTACHALEMGADWINDVSGGQSPDMRKIVAQSQADFVMMHSLEVPARRGQSLPMDRDPVTQLRQWAQDQISYLEREGLSSSRVVFDPGIGFGKSPEQTWEILRNIQQFNSLGVRTLIGHSRKSFLTSVTPNSVKHGSERDPETRVITLDLIRKGVDYLRLHDFSQWDRTLRVWTHLDGVTRWGD